GEEAAPDSGLGEGSGEAFGAGLPLGKAVLNLPLKRIAIGYEILSLFSPLRTASAPAWSIAASTRPAWVEDLTSTSSFRPSAGFPVNTPENGNNRSLMAAPNASCLLIPSLVTDRMVGSDWTALSRCTCVAKAGSASTFVAEN